MKSATLTVFAALMLGCVAQRSPYAGRRPIGYPEIIPSTTVTSDLGNRFGDESTPSTTTQRLPLEARGDAELVKRLSKLPIDQQPFWLINWQALESNRQKPQTYAIRPNGFIAGNSNTMFFWK